MRSTTSVTYNVTGQTLELRVPYGRPTSATFKVFNDYAGDDDTTEFTGTATVDSFSTTVSVASGEGTTDTQRLNVASSSDAVASRRYLVSETGKQEWIQPIEVATGYLRLRSPLRSAYTTAATLVSTYLTAAIDSTWVADLSNINAAIDPNPGYRVRWSVVVSGVTYVIYSYFDLVRAPTRHDVDITDVNDRAPGLIDSMPIEYQIEQGRPLIESAWLAVQAKLAVHDIDVDSFRNDQILDELVILKALRILAGGGWKPSGYASLGDYIIDTERDYETFVQQSITVVNRPRLATGTSGAAERVTAQPFWSK